MTSLDVVLNDARVSAPPCKIFDADRGAPLCWQELNVDLRRTLPCLDGRTVMDLSTGSASAGRAWLRLWIQYVVVCFLEAHQRG